MSYYLFQILSLGSLTPMFWLVPFTLSALTAEFVNLTLYSYMGIGVIILVCLCIREPVSEKVVNKMYILLFLKSRTTLAIAIIYMCT